MENREQKLQYSISNIMSQVFPLLEVGLKKLLQELNKNQAVGKYQGDLIQRKLYDRCQKKYIERQLLKRQLGDQYQSSDSEGEVDYEVVGDMSRSTMYRLIREKLISKKFDPLMLQQVEEQQRTQKHIQVQLEEINEDQNQQQQVVQEKFNPLLFLANQMQKAYKLSKLNIA